MVTSGNEDVMRSPGVEPLPASSPPVLALDRNSIEDGEGSATVHEASAVEDELNTAVQDSCEIGTSSEQQQSSEEADAEDFFFTQAEFGTPFLDSDTLSVGDAYIMILDYVLREGMNWSQVVELQRLINRLVQQKVLPESKYLLLSGTCTHRNYALLAFRMLF